MVKSPPLLLVASLSLLLSSDHTCESTCLVPSRDILDACNVGHLSLVTQNNLVVRNEALCNSELSQGVVTQKLNLKIENFYSFDFTKNTTFTVVMVDVTSNKLLWMLSNISSMNGDMSTTQSSTYNPYVITVKDYSPPVIPRFPPGSNLIQIFIFQEDNNKISQRPQPDPFYIRDWVMQGQSSQARQLMCGPVAGLQFRVNPASSRDLKSLGKYVSGVSISRARRGFPIECLVLFLSVALSCQT